MEILSRRPDGTPGDVEMTCCEEVVFAIVGNLTDRGIPAGEALVMLRGSDIAPDVLTTDCALDACLSDVEFVAYLIQYP